MKLYTKSHKKSDEIMDALVFPNKHKAKYGYLCHNCGKIAFYYTKMPVAGEAMTYELALTLKYEKMAPCFYITCENCSITFSTLRRERFLDVKFINTTAYSNILYTNTSHKGRKIPEKTLL